MCRKNNEVTGICKTGGNKILTYKGIVSAVAPDSLAAELGLVPGDRLLMVNNQPIQDIIDLSFALADEYVEVLIEKTNGEQQLYEIEKDYSEDLGIEFESAVFDKVRQCANNCIFCFVDQMPAGMRETLYIKDDDYRLSFLYGNFITLTNLGPRDMKRIRQLHLSPLFVSIHTTDGPLRAKMLNNERASEINKQLDELMEQGIEFHGQIVLCPGFNDGVALDKTIGDLYARIPSALSLAIVPVGLTRHRDHCYPLQGFTPQQAGEVIDMVDRWQQKCRAEKGTSFVYLGDEFYLSAGRTVPQYDNYDGFPQLENGVGIVRNFIEEWNSQPQSAQGYEISHAIDVVCGHSAAKVLDKLIAQLAIPNLKVRLVEVENHFFGPHITVTGLLTGGDIMTTLAQLPGPRTGVIIPGISLKKGQSVFLDERTPADIEKTVGVPVRTAYFAQDLLQLLREWR